MLVVSSNWAYEMGIGVQENFDTAVEWSRKAAMQGHAESQLHLGSAYYLLYYESGAEKDYDAAEQWLRKAAAQGSDYAKNELSDLLEEK